VGGKSDGQGGGGSDRGGLRGKRLRSAGSHSNIKESSTRIRRVARNRGTASNQGIVLVERVPGKPGGKPRL